MKDPCIQYRAVEDTDNQMNLNEHEIRDNWKIETKGNNKDHYIQSCHYYV